MNLQANRLGNFVKKNVAILLIVFFSFFIRIVFLDQYPPGITHDELNYVIAAKSLFWGKSFTPGTAPAVLPTAMANYDVVIADVPALILAVTTGPFNNSLLASRILGAILSTFIVLSVFLLTKHFTQSTKISLITSFISAINPWSLLMGRTIFEVNFFDFFFLWGFLVLLYNKGWKILYALPFYLLGFLSYTGGQIAFYLFMVFTLIYGYSTHSPVKKQLKPFLVFFIAITLLLISYVIIILHNQSFSSRGGEIYTPQRPEINAQVDQERKLAVPAQINSLFINKLTVYLTGFLSKYLNAFSVDKLFLNGEFRAAFSYQKHGTFYFIDLFFIILGLSYLFAINKKGWFLILAIIAAMPITSGLSTVEQSYSERAGLMFPFLIILCGTGVGYLTTLKPKITAKILSFSAMVIYLLLFINLLHLYFYRFPVYASDGWFLQDRLLSHYLKLSSEKLPAGKTIVITPEPKIVFEEYLFFTNTYQGKNVPLLISRLNDRQYSFNNIVFQNSCPDETLNSDVTVIYDSKIQCKKKLTEDKYPLRITRLQDVYENYLIEQDKICNNQKLARIIPLEAHKNFKIEDQPINSFCRNWITKLN
ncbi:MAG: hypothetical protein M1426_05745 [Patescibacteria group bacterium]|nr:hypothetical protein [Patescibacteria group bacterium]